MNKRYIFPLCLMLSVALCLTSCLKDNEETDLSVYDDIAITSFSLSAVIRNIHTTSSAGADSTYKSTVTSGLPVFSIDHYKGQIYNTDSLPSDCDLSKVVVTASSKNSGQILIKSLADSTFTFYSLSDSLDFTRPREFRVYSLNGESYRSYTVTLNKKRSAATGIHWTEVAADDSSIPASLNQVLAVTAGGDGTFRLSKDGGNTWSDELLGEGEDASLLPATDIAWVSMPNFTTEDCDYELMAGTIGSDDTYCTVWRKIVEKQAGAAPAKWVYMPKEVANLYYLPRLSGISLVWFDNNLYASGNGGTIYKSRDQGITWKLTADISLPDDMESLNVKLTTSDDDTLWLRNTDSGKVWRGSLIK